MNSIQITLFHFEDEPRPGVADVIRLLRDQEKFRVMMLTGDHESSALRVGNAVGIAEIHCGLKPEDKLNHVVRISRETGNYNVGFSVARGSRMFFSL